VQFSWDKIFRSLQNTFYTDLWLLVCILASIVCGIISRPRELAYKALLVYSVVSLVCIVLWAVIKSSGTSKANEFLQIEFVNVSLSIVEFITFYIFFTKNIRSNRVKPVSNVAITIFLLLSFLFFLDSLSSTSSTDMIKKWSFQLNIFEFLLILIACLYFFYEQFTKQESVSLTGKSSFWIVTGVFFYVLVSLPFFLIGPKLYSYSHFGYFLMSSIHYISLGFLFIFLSKAFLCNRVQMT
jgi:hypothetical protein